MYRHGNRITAVADTPMQMQTVRLEISRPRFRCESCGVMHTPELSFLDKKRRATFRLIDAIREKCLSTTFHSMSQQTGLAVNTVKNIAHDLINDLDRTVRYETPIIMGIDKVMLGDSYCCIITNLVTNSIFDILEATTDQHLTGYLAGLPDKDRIEWVYTNLWMHYKTSFGTALPHARLVIDKSHVLRLASDALEAECKRIYPKIDKDNRIGIKDLLGWLPLKRQMSLNPKDLRTLEAVRENYPSLATAYCLKDAFYGIYDRYDKASAMQSFEVWENRIPNKGSSEFRSLAKTVRFYHDDIFDYWDSPLKNAYAESLHGLIKIANRIGRKYSFEILRAKMLYAQEARKVGNVVRVTDNGQPAIPTTETRSSIEYGPHIPTLVMLLESGQLN